MADRHHMTIYTAPGCMRCRGTIRTAEKLGVTRLNIVDLSQDALAAEGLRLEGYTELPVVRVWAEDPGDLAVATWSGHRPDKVAEHAEACGALADKAVA
ncbi:glutaredoxin domain-containing protein [Corynebacterium sp. USCH3]|uniref:glutaredoxin domain-containing protein n=1 Tax=Corynebacterium sp. USCH3 TaxID=3024840 RepID=UPI0030AC8D88